MALFKLLAGKHHRRKVASSKAALMTPNEGESPKAHLERLKKIAKDKEIPLPPGADTPGAVAHLLVSATETFKRGDLIESETNLLRNNGPGVPPKFALIDPNKEHDTAFAERRKGESIENYQSRLDAEIVRLQNLRSHSTEETPATDALDADDLRNMGMEQLQQLAKDRHIDLRGVTKKNDMIREIIAQVQAQTASRT